MRHKWIHLKYGLLLSSRMGNIILKKMKLTWKIQETKTKYPKHSAAAAKWF